MARARGLAAVVGLAALLSAALLVMPSAGAATPSRVGGDDGDLVAPVATGPSRVFDSSPKHLWNRLYAGLVERTARDGRVFGRDEVDPLLWEETEHLLVGPSHARAIELLDEFLAGRGERLVADPVRRAVLQHDLWAVFDWTVRRDRSHPDAARELQIRLAAAIRRLALTKAEIDGLPDTYARAAASGEFARGFDPERSTVPFLPPDLFRPDGPWVFVARYGGESTTPAHASAFSRSSFLVFVRLPGGREATIDYLGRVAGFADPWIPDPQTAGRLAPNPRLPQFPVGTQVALVRRMLVVDDAGELRPTPIVESVQIRTHRAVGDRVGGGFRTDSEEQILALSNVELGIRRERLFAARAGGLRAVESDEIGFSVLGSHGWDVFEMDSGEPERFMARTTRQCAACHTDPGIHSVLSRGDSKLVAGYTIDGEADRAVRAKRSRFDWGLLSGLWRAGDRAVRR